MTHANTEQTKFVPWFAKAGAACSIVPIARFIGPNIFALKGGGYGCLFALTGMDEEGLTDQELESRMRSIEGALRGLPEGSCLYQYTRVMSGYELPRQKTYSNAVTQVFVDDRLTFLEKTAAFRRIDLHWCLTIEPPKLKAFERKPQEHSADTSRMLAELQKSATILEGHLGGLLGLRLLDKQTTFQFFSYLFNLEEWASQAQLRDDTGVDRQIVSNPVAWHSDHLRIGKRYVQMYSLKTTPEASRPCLFSGLLTLDCDSVLCSTWRPKSTSAARSEIDAQEKFISFFKVGVLTRVMSGRDTASLETGAGAKAANSSVDDLSLVIRELDKKAQGEYSLRLLLAANSAEQLRDTAPAVHRIFVDARAQVIEETLGNLCAFYAMFPGNGKFNVFPMWLSEEHHARLSSVFAPHIGHPHSEDLDSEYLNVFETRTRTPFFQDVYVDGVRVMLIIGPTGSGKSVVGNATVALEQKYGGFTYIFDIGGSYESVVELYGGRVDRIGKDGPRVALFSLEPTESNIKFLYSFIKLLLTNGGAELEPEDDDVIHKAVQDMYLLDPENRRLSNLFLPKKLDRYLSKWVGRGVYSAIFDNVEDSLSLSRVIPTLGQHVPHTEAENKWMFGSIPNEIILPHDWRGGVSRVGEIPTSLVAETTGGVADWAIPVDLNSTLMDEPWDLIVNIGHVVPHEVLGFANHNKNYFIGLGGKETICASHIAAAVYGIENSLGCLVTPLRACYNYAEEKLLGHLPDVYFQIVMQRDAENRLVTSGVFVGDDLETYLQAARLSRKQNITIFDKPVKKVVAVMQADEFRATWVANKAVYRTRMAIADGGELLIIAPGVERFGEQPEVDALIRKYGYKGTPRTLALYKTEADMQAIPHGVAHLIHGSSEGRFTITYAPGDLSKQEIEQVGYQYADVKEMQNRYDPAVMKEGWNTMADGEKVFYISTPSAGLWSTEAKLNNPARRELAGL